MRINPFFAFVFVALQLGVVFAQENRELPIVKVVGTGGTIAHVPARGGTPDYYVNPDKVIDDFRQDLEGVARVEVEDLLRKGSHTLTMKDFLAVA